MMSETAENKKLFWACFIALVATSFFFGLRGVVVPELRSEFGLSSSGIGRILGVGLWPFAFSIIFFSLIIDKIGYKACAYFAIVAHTVAVLGTLLAVQQKSVELLYWSTFLVAVANGAVEGFINPVVATIFNKEKSKWLNILHAGWPAGMALGAAFGLVIGEASLMVKFGICLIPVVFYALLTFPRTFPVQERVAAGVSYRDMLLVVGAFGFFLMTLLVVMGIAQITESELSYPLALGIAAAVGLVAFIYTRSMGNVMFLVILLSMPLLATTELGTDSWMADLLSADLGALAGWIFVLSSVIMTILRFYAGPIVHKFSPTGLLVASAALATIGLLFLGVAPGSLMVVAAITYALGKTFLWSTTLGVVSEQFPKGGALTLNGVSAIGVLGMGIIGAPLMGKYLDEGIDKDLKTKQALYAKVNGDVQPTMFGKVPSLDTDVVDKLSEEEKKQLDEVVNPNKKRAFLRQAAIPAVLLLIYLGLFFHFRSRGGYKPVELGAE